MSSSCVAKHRFASVFTLAISKCYGKVRVLFFRATTHFTRQVAHFTRSWSSGKMLAFQPRDFVFEPVGMRLFFFTSIPKQKVLTFFGTVRLFGFVRPFFENFSLKTPESPFIFLKFCNRMDVDKSQRVPFSGIVTFFKRNNFCVKIRFSQVRHAISDFC